jgi:protein-tyrosine-phosphatase/predicted ATP-grasp superfamily ATP-dependent carboligase
MIIPSSDTALALAAECHAAFRGRLRIACPAPPIVARVLEKDVTLRIAEECGLCVPPTYKIEGLTELEAMRDLLKFPIVAKDRSKWANKRSSFKARYFSSYHELGEAFRADPELGSRVLLQEYCEGVGVGIAMLIHGGQPIAAFQHRRLKELPYTGGVAVSAVSEPLDPLLAQQALELLRAIEWEGIAMVEFRQNGRNGQAAFMEVNGRYWGTCSLAVQCGVDFPFYEWQLAHDEVPVVPESYRSGQTWRWTAGTIQRIHALFANPAAGHEPHPSRWRELADAIVDFGPTVGSALASFEDPLPSLFEVGRTVKALATTDTKRVLRRVIPRRIKHHIQAYRNLGTDGGWCYVRSALARSMGLGPKDWAFLGLGPARSILFVCHGNIIRSPMAEALLKRLLRGVDRRPIVVNSAGLYAKPGTTADARALVASREMGISLDEHRSQQISGEMVAGADLIFVMDYQNEARLLNRFPASRRKVHILSGRREHRRSYGLEIADPYQGSLEDVRDCYRVLDARIRELAAALSKCETPSANGVAANLSAADSRSSGG